MLLFGNCLILKARIIDRSMAYHSPELKQTLCWQYCYIFLFVWHSISLCNSQLHHLLALYQSLVPQPGRSCVLCLVCCMPYHCFIKIVDKLVKVISSFCSVLTIHPLLLFLQVLTYKGFYDSNLEWVGLEGVQIVASMTAGSTLGRHRLSTRFTSVVRICSVG